MSLIIELNASADMFYPLKHLLLLNLVIFKQKCNNLIVNEIMVLNASYVCFLHSRFVENHLIWILEDVISEVVLSQLVSELDRR
jgi:nicotinamide riboside transporter PnuC